MTIFILLHSLISLRLAVFTNSSPGFFKALLCVAVQYRHNLICLSLLASHSGESRYLILPVSSVLPADCVIFRVQVSVSTRCDYSQFLMNSFGLCWSAQNRIFLYCEAACFWHLYGLSSGCPAAVSDKWTSSYIAHFDCNWALKVLIQCLVSAFPYSVWWMVFLRLTLLWTQVKLLSCLCHIPPPRGCMWLFRSGYLSNAEFSSWPIRSHKTCTASRRLGWWCTPAPCLRVS